MDQNHRNNYFISKTDNNEMKLAITLQRELIITKTEVIMKTIYECSQRKSVNWGYLAVWSFAVFSTMYLISRGIFNLTMALLLLMALILTPSIMAFFLFPLYIVADDEGVGIRTLARTNHIPYANIDRIVRVDGQKLLSRIPLIKVFGSGGVFGYVGWPHLKGIGNIRSYVVDEKNVFLIIRKKGIPVAISVNDPDEFLPYYLKGGEI